MNSPPDKTLSPDEMDFYNSRRAKFIAACIAISIEVVLAAFSAKSNDRFSFGNHVVAITFYVITVFFILHILDLMANERPLKNGSHKNFNTWGFLWRYYLASWLSYIFLAATLAVIGRGELSLEPSVKITATTSLIRLIYSPIAIWVLFSKERKAQFKWVVGLLSRA